MNALLVILLIAAGARLFIQRRRLQDAEYWRDYWSRRHDEMARELGEALSLADDKGTEALQARAQLAAGARERADVEHALTRLWPRLEVQVPEEGAAVAVLRAAFPSLPVPGKSQNGSDSLPLSPEKKAQAQEVLARLRERTSCPKCKHPYCAAPNRCDDPEHVFGGIGR